MIKYPSRYWALVSAEAGAGKSTFVASNSRPPVYVIDADGRFDAVAPLVGGNVTAPKTAAGRGIGRAGGLVMLDEAEDAVNAGAKTIIVDSVTKIFEYHARRASMAGQLSSAQRQALGFNKLKAKDMVDKSNVMSVLATMASLGTDMYYIWHLRKTIDVNSRSFDPFVKDRISKVELETLGTSIAVRLNFFREGDNYGVIVESARDLGGRKSNTGFTIYDFPENYWRGGAKRLERLIYTSFTSADDAISWGMKELGNDDPGEIGGLYDFVKSESSPKRPSDMWVAWVQHIDSLNAERAKSGPAPTKQAQTSPEPVEIRSQPAVSPADDTSASPASQTPAEVAPASRNHEQMYYTDGSEVSPEDAVDFVKYQDKFGKDPSNQQVLLRAMKMAQDSGGEW